MKFSLDHTNYFKRFSTDYFYFKFLPWALAFLCFFMRMRNRHLNTKLRLLLKISPIPVFDTYIHT